jgi:hypothetical protein
MESAWPNVRYWVALCSAVLLALLAFSGFGMGGPLGGPTSMAVGWLLFAVFLAAPIAIWWTRKSRLASYVQYLLLSLVFLLIGYFAVVAFYA